MKCDKDKKYVMIGNEKVRLCTHPDRNMFLFCKNAKEHNRCPEILRRMVKKGKPDPHKYRIIMREK
jgi:hypothetical protein